MLILLSVGLTCLITFAIYKLIIVEPCPIRKGRFKPCIYNFTCALWSKPFYYLTFTCKYCEDRWVKKYSQKDFINDLLRWNYSKEESLEICSSVKEKETRVFSKEINKFKKEN
jgi:hypothetical protein